MEQDNLPCALDREVFERVWRRVMPEDRPDSPIELLNRPSPSADAVDEEPLPWLAPLVPGPGVPSPAQAMTATPPAPMVAALPALREEAPAPDNDVPCLGASSAVYSGLLQQYIDRELAGFRTYQALSRRAPGGAGRTLSTMAADERRHAKRLSAAYFLISGVRYWPGERPHTPLPLSFPAALRLAFADEQRDEATYLAAAEETCDAALRELYLDMAQDEHAHTWLLRGILEQL